MALTAIHKEVDAALERIEAKNPDMKSALDHAHGYAVFPATGRASALVGISYGRGDVFERGKLIGEATMGQVTIGVQVGGQTYDEIVIFNSENALERFKRGRFAFTANASAVVVKAAASGTVDYERDVVAKAFSRGGMLLEASLGAQRFNFKPLTNEVQQGTSEARERGDGKQRPTTPTASPGEASKAVSGQKKAGEKVAQAAARVRGVQAKVASKMGSLKTRQHHPE